MTNKKLFGALTWIGLIVVMALALAACGSTAGEGGVAPTSEAGAPGTLPETGGTVTGTLPGGSMTGTAVIVTTPEMMPTAEATTEMMPTAEATSELGGTGGMTGTMGAGEEVTIDLTAQNTQFSTSTITVPAGAHVIVNFTNNDDGTAHNFAVYDSQDMTETFFQGELVTGPDSTTYEFDAPETPGTYWFQCDPHAPIMNGQFIVTSADDNNS